MSRPLSSADASVHPATGAYPAAARWVVIALCLGAIGVAWLLPAAPPGGGLSVGGTTLPDACGLKRIAGIPCPGCGLTRSWVAALEGDLAGSVAFHPVGWLVLLYAGAQALRHLLWMAVVPWRAGVERAGLWLDRGLVLILAVLLVVWIPRIARILVLTFAS
jgi:hypothetical protein